MQEGAPSFEGARALQVFELEHEAAVAYAEIIAWHLDNRSSPDPGTDARVCITNAFFAELFHVLITRDHTKGTGSRRAELGT